MRRPQGPGCNRPPEQAASAPHSAQVVGMHATPQLSVPPLGDQEASSSQGQWRSAKGTAWVTVPAEGTTFQTAPRPSALLPLPTRCYPGRTTALPGNAACTGEQPTSACRTQIPPSILCVATTGYRGQPLGQGSQSRPWATIQACR